MNIRVSGSSLRVQSSLDFYMQLTSINKKSLPELRKQYLSQFLSEELKRRNYSEGLGSGIQISNPTLSKSSDVENASNHIDTVLSSRVETNLQQKGIDFVSHGRYVEVDENYKETIADVKEEFKEKNLEVKFVPHGRFVDNPSESYLGASSASVAKSSSIRTSEVISNPVFVSHGRYVEEDVPVVNSKKEIDQEDIVFTNNGRFVDAEEDSIEKDSSAGNDSFELEDEEELVSEDNDFDFTTDDDEGFVFEDDDFFPEEDASDGEGDFLYEDEVDDSSDVDSSEEDEGFTFEDDDDFVFEDEGDATPEVDSSEEDEGFTFEDDDDFVFEENDTSDGLGIEYSEEKEEEEPWVFADEEGSIIEDIPEVDVTPEPQTQRVLPKFKSEVSLEDEGRGSVDVPPDLREFLRQHPCSPVEYVLKFYSKKEVDKQLALGRIYKKKGKLMI